MILRIPLHKTFHCFHTKFLIFFLKQACFYKYLFYLCDKGIYKSNHKKHIKNT